LAYDFAWRRREIKYDELTSKELGIAYAENVSSLGVISREILEMKHGVTSNGKQLK